MNIEEKAKEYAQNKMQQVLNDAVAEAYVEGYKQGYKDCEAKMPQEVTAGDVEYVDLGLPSGTLWAKDYVKKDGEYLYLPYCDAEKLSIPSEEQFDELKKWCKFQSFQIGEADKYRCKLLGGNGIYLTMENIGLIDAGSKRFFRFFEFWLLNKVDQIPDKKTAYADSSKLTTSTEFSGYKLPIRLVKSSK